MGLLSVSTYVESYLTKTKEKYVDIVYAILHCLVNIDIFRLEIKIDLVPRFIIYVFRQQLLKILNNVFRFYLTFSIKATDGGVDGGVELISHLLFLFPFCSSSIIL